MCAITPQEGSSPSEAAAWIRTRIEDELAKPEEQFCADGKTPEECIALLKAALRHQLALLAITAKSTSVKRAVR